MGLVYLRSWRKSVGEEKVLLKNTNTAPKLSAPGNLFDLDGYSAYISNTSLDLICVLMNVNKP